MEPIKINITLDLGNKAMEAVKRLTWGNYPPQAFENEPVPVHAPEPPKPETKPAPIPETKEVPTPEPVQEPAVKTEITDEELRAIIKSARSRSATAPVTIRNVIFPEFGIKTSIECPMDKRPALVDRLNQISA